MNAGFLFYATGACLSGCQVHSHASLDDLRLVPVMASLQAGTQPRRALQLSGSLTGTSQCTDSRSEGRFLWNPIGTGRREAGSSGG